MATKPFVPGWERAETVGRNYEGAFASPDHLIFPFLPIRYHSLACGISMLIARYFRDSEAKGRDRKHSGP